MPVASKPTNQPTNQQPIQQLEGHIHSADVDRDGLAVQQLILGLGLFGLVVGLGEATKLADVVGMYANKLLAQTNFIHFVQNSVQITMKSKSKIMRE